QAATEWLAGGACVTRILTPSCAEPRFHHVAAGHAGEAHTIALPKSAPMSLIFRWQVDERTEPRANGSTGEAGRSNSAGDDPLQTLFRADYILSAERDRDYQGH